MKTRISSMLSPKGNPVPNHVIIQDGDDTFFQSYGSIIVKETREDGNRVVYLDETYLDYSRTTQKYRAIFLGENAAEVKAKIKSGEYRFANLN